ncbi:MAG: hypothetical protein J0L54_08330 [Chitinophagales bacterium]|nr:hypothetical protein [Chitinophagales bacterium]
MADTAHRYFTEVYAASKENLKIWDIDLYGPLLIVNPITRQAYANYPDSAGILKKDKNIYTGKLPGNILIGNASLDWGGRRWAMVLTFFLNHADLKDRVDLFLHELFHRVQPSLGFANLKELPNDHLDKREGRIYLRLELEALKKALTARATEERRLHVKHALQFRAYRYQLYPGALETEGSVEINEGMASYTGKAARQLGDKELVELLCLKIDSFFRQKNYVKLFAYETVPAYGFLLRDTDPYWNKKVNKQTNLTHFFGEALRNGLQDHTITQGEIEATADLYGGKYIAGQETDREETMKKIVAGYKRRFLEQPHFELAFTGKKSISSDSRLMVSIEDLGRVNPSMKIIADWGILDIKETGGFLTPNLDKVIITVPLKTEKNIVSGDGWVLTVNPGYEVVREEKSGNYFLVKLK